MGILFELMAEFARTRNAFAPVVYKSIIFALIESHKDQGGELRALILGRLGATLASLPHLPVGVMVEPLTKQLSLHGRVTGIRDITFPVNGTPLVTILTF